MLFKELKQNYIVHILDKNDLTYTQGRVTSVSLPRLSSNNNGIINPINQQPAVMVVDVTIEASGRSATYTIPENLSITYAGSLVLSTEINGINRELEGIKSTAEQALKMVDRQKELLEKSSALLMELNPIYKEKKETEERFTKIEDSVSEMKNMLSNFIREFKA